MKKSALVAAYQKKLHQHGPSAQALQWTDRASQYARFEIISAAASELQSVLDVGCGLADLCHFLRSKGLNTTYTGVEIVPEFVNLASKSLCSYIDATVLHLDADTVPLPTGHCWAVTSGLFNNIMDDNWRFMTQMLHKMYSVAEIGISFNAMSTWVEYRNPDLWYVDPMEVFAFCKKELGGHPVLRHDYITRDGGFPFEFTMYVYKHPFTATNNRQDLVAYA